MFAGVIDREDRLCVGAVIFNHTAPIEHVGIVIGVLDDREHVLDRSGHHAALLPSFTIQRVSLSRLRWTEKYNSSIFAFDECLHDWLHALSVKLILLLNFAEDIVEVKCIGIVAITSTCLPIARKNKPQQS